MVGADDGSTSAGAVHRAASVPPRLAEANRELELARAYEALKEAQAKLVHSSKLAAIGQIAGGVAHEVNNPATFILTNLRVMRDSVGVLRRSVGRLGRELVGTNALPAERQAVVDGILAGGKLEELLRELHDMIEDNLAGVERIASIVRDLRTFSRIERDDVREVHVNDIVDAACNLAYAEIRHRARLVKEFSRLPSVAAEPGKLAQVFTNLLLNAAHAIEQGAANDHEIRVSTYRDGPSVVVAVEDTGCGIPDDVQARIFEPFSMAKVPDFGKGLGLALCAEIVRQHRGTIEVQSEVGRGSRFEVRLPASGRDARAAELEEEPARAPREAPLRARVLVIDDEPAVLRAYRRMLSLRHDVVLAAGGGEGLSVLEKDTAFDVILCDLMMPEIDGPMFYDALRERAPALVPCVVFCSGGAFTARAKEFLGSVKNAFLPKPIDVPALENLIQEARKRRA
jgi:signal transduction histidine kinase/ActR/RegA family two-component response regulator